MNTKGIIIEALRELLTGKKIDSITVQDILETAHCSRGTFYRHFKDKYDVMNYYYFESNRQVLSDPALVGKARIRTIVDTLMNNADYFCGVVDTQGVNSFENFVRNCSRQYFLDRYLKKTEPEQNIPGGIIFKADFLSGGYASIIKDWVINKNILSRNELVDCLYELTPEMFV